MTNDQRAERARAALRDAFVQADNPADALVYALVDMQHLYDQLAIDKDNTPWTALVQRAFDIYTWELERRGD